jgi:subtilisin family serine protease
LFTGTSVQDRVKIGSPGSASSAITVASYTTKIEWNDVDGVRRAVGLTLDDISDFSSEGPRRDNARKPDVAAPGAMIAASLSADSNAPRAMMIDARHVMMAGTSMATPFITGVVALLLQRDPTLRPNDVKALLKAQSSIPGRAAGSFDAKWGFGLLDMLNL